ncbi:MAG: Hint domain-containing protein [Cyanobacteria bacterium P01_F01_bin.3]
MADIQITTLLDENDGVNVGAGTSLREAIIQANAAAEDTTITLGAGTYTLSLTGRSEDAAATGDLDITNSDTTITIQGAGEDVTIIDADTIDRVFDVLNGATLILKDLTVTGGEVVDSDPGIRDGAGILVRAESSVEIESSTITANSAVNDGGGISNREESTVVISNSTISENTADNDGGGIENKSGDILIFSSTISGNSAGDDGGGVANNIEYYESGVALIVNSTISGNTAAEDGGGIDNDYGAVFLSSSTVTDNEADYGGALYNNDLGLVVLDNSIISGNRATTEGDEIYNGSYLFQGTTYYGEIVADANNLFGNNDNGKDDASAFVNFAPGDNDINATSDDANVAIESILQPLDDNGGSTQTHALVASGPAVDAGDNEAAQFNGLAFDQRGEARVVDGPDADDIATIDIGAFEECFLTGTLIATEKGAVPVETLQIGDRVKTADGQMEPIKWMGHQTYDRASGLPHPFRTYPICVKAGALGNNLPVRNLYVSPDHALFIDGLLINAGALTNGISIVQIEMEQFEYHHIELEHHALLLAEGTPAESYLPQTQARELFDNGEEYEKLYPNHSSLSLLPMNTPRVNSKRQLPRFVSQRLNRLANMPSVTAIHPSSQDTADEIHSAIALKHFPRSAV